jgi:hypothetical protein
LSWLQVRQLTGREEPTLRPLPHRAPCFPTRPDC